MEHDPYAVIGKLYTELYYSKTVFDQLKQQMADKDTYIEALKQELDKHKTTLQGFVDTHAKD